MSKLSQDRRSEITNKLLIAFVESDFLTNLAGYIRDNQYSTHITRDKLTMYQDLLLTFGFVSQSFPSYSHKLPIADIIIDLEILIRITISVNQKSLIQDLMNKFLELQTQIKERRINDAIEEQKKKEEAKLSIE